MIDTFVGVLAALVTADVVGAFVIGPLVRRHLVNKQKKAYVASMKQAEALQTLFEQQQAQDQADAEPAG